MEYMSAWRNDHITCIVCFAENIRTYSTFYGRHCATKTLNNLFFLFVGDIKFSTNFYLTKTKIKMIEVQFTGVNFIQLWMLNHKDDILCFF